MGQNVVRDHEGSGLELPAGELEEVFVLLLLCIEEDQVEDVVDRGQGLEGIALDKLGPLLEPGVGDVAAPGLDLGRVVLELEDPASEVAHACCEPDRGVPARAADLEHFAVRLRGYEREEEPARVGGDLAAALLAGNALLALPRVLFLEAREHGANSVVEHGPEPTAGRKCSPARV